MKQNFALKIYFLENPGNIPEDLWAVASKYNATFVDTICEEDGRFFTMAKLVKPTALDSINFLKDLGTVKGINTIIGGSYNPGLVERIADYMAGRDKR